MFTKIIYTVLFLVGISFNAQSKDGINFQTKNLEEAKETGSAGNKLIFIDLYTDMVRTLQANEKEYIS